MTEPPRMALIDVTLANGWVIKPVVADGRIQLCDMFDPDGRWHGSRRTVRLCRNDILSRGAGARRQRKEEEP